mmetsp:Transcript_553/g.1434  ORF Transcript_553/g.1434 Transcript_553/m.1434 type:complete len:205 (+) Transcript_553:658-1272(+)
MGRHGWARGCVCLGCGDGRYHCRRLSGAQSPQAQRSRVSGGPSRLQPLQQGPARGAVHARGGGGQAPPEPVRHHRGGHGPEPPHRQLWPGKDRRRIQIVGQGERGNGALSDARGGVVPRQLGVRELRGRSEGRPGPGARPHCRDSAVRQRPAPSQQVPQPGVPDQIRSAAMCPSAHGLPGGGAAILKRQQYLQHHCNRQSGGSR